LHSFLPKVLSIRSNWRFHQLGRRIDDVLAIVEDQEEPLSSDGPSDGLGGNLVTAELEAEDARDRGGTISGSDSEASSTN
jgi:hypothetical protein